MPHSDFATIHERMVRNVFLNVELLLNDDIRVISEYDVQALMFLHFRRVFVNTDRRVEREREGKVDCVVYEDELPCAFYEIKTYFKDNEKLSKQHFDHDIDKMYLKLEANPDARGYILVAGAKSKFRGEALDEFDFIESHLRKDSKEWTPYTLTSGQAVRLRPSQKQHRGQSVVITWEVKAAKSE
jgi:hypothetical protein